MTPFVTQVAGCACPRCIAFATPIAPPTLGGGFGGLVPPPAGVAPHEVWDRLTPPPIEGFVQGQVVETPQTVVPPMGMQPGEVAVPPIPVEQDPLPTVTYPIVPRDVQIVPVGTPLANVIGFPANPFLT